MSKSNGMRHKHSRIRLRYKPAHSRVLQRNLVTSVLLYESVRTTKKRAEVVQPVIDHLITVAKTRPAHVAIRAINKIVTHKNASRKTMEVFRERFATRSSGFTRLVPLGMRHGDGAKMVRLELVDATEVTNEKSPTKPKSPRSPKKKSSVSSDSSVSSESSKKS
ncbi:MAG: large subunit ribosomal protein L17 [Candidatus Peregrinibacteria bacterium Greene0416_19]|nr:MAG: large subunit ribosomal protein L17 [Candidatus Peregrinibacteria bacterium Greene0416_19]